MKGFMYCVQINYFEMDKFVITFVTLYRGFFTMCLAWCPFS